MEVNLSSQAPFRSQASNTIHEHSNLPIETTTSIEAPYLLSEAWSDLADFKTINKQ